MKQILNSRLFLGLQQTAVARKSLSWDGYLSLEISMQLFRQMENRKVGIATMSLAVMPR